MSLRWPDKDPSAIKKYGLDWAAMLETGETISTSVWSILPAGPTLGIKAIVGSICTTFISGGTNNIDYTVTNRIETSLGVTDERSIILAVREQ